MNSVGQSAFVGGDPAHLGIDGDFGNGRSQGLVGSIDFGAIWAGAYRSRFWIGGIVLGAMVLGVLGTLLTTPIYRAVATVQIDQEAAKVLGTEDTDLSAAIQDSDRFLKTQLDVIRSRSLAVTVAEDLGAFDDPEFLKKMNQDPEVEAYGVRTAEEVKRELVIQLLSDNLGVSLPIDSRVASITFDSPDPRLAAQVANSYAENYIRSNLQRKFDTSAYAREFLKGQLDEAAARLAESERQALNYARATRIINTSNGGQGDGSQAGPKSLIAATLVQLNTSYAAALSRRIEAEQKWNETRTQPVLSIPEVLNNLAIQRLLEERAKLEAAYEEQLQRRRADHPAVKQAKASIDEIESQIAQIASSIRETIKSDYQAALKQEKALDRQIVDLKSDTLDEQGKSVQLGILQRQTDNNRELYDLLLRRYNELNAEAGVQANNVAIVDRAEAPDKPVLPNIPLNLALSLVAGIGLAGAFVFVREQFFDKVRTAEDLLRKVGVPALGAIPFVKDGANIAEEAQDNKTTVSEAFASVRSSLMLSSAHGLPTSIMFTSAQQGEGKSSACFATALALGRVGKSVLLIDLDLRRPRQHHLFGVDNSSGMANLLTHNASIDDVIHSTEFDGISVIPSGGIAPNPTELLASQAFRDLVRELEKRFDVVLIDSPPLLALADAVEIGSVTDASIFVVEAARSASSTLRSAIERLRHGGGNVVGGLLTKFDPKESGYGYYYAYDYQYKTDA